MHDRVKVEAMLRAGTPFGQIEDRIDSMHVSEDAKSALWLLAWGARGTNRRGRILEGSPPEVLPAG